MLVRGRNLTQLVKALAEAGHQPQEASGGLLVPGVTTDEVGELAATHSAVLHELTAQRGSLEEAFMQLTREDVEYHAHGLDPAARPGGAPTAQPTAQPHDQVAPATAAPTGR